MEKLEQLLKDYDIALAIRARATKALRDAINADPELCREMTPDQLKLVDTIYEERG